MSTAEKFQPFSGYHVSFSDKKASPETKSKEPIYETPDGKYVVILGVHVKKAEVPVATREPFDFKMTSTSLGILRDIAVSYSAGLPIIISGDSGIGKTAALKKFSELIGAHLHLVNINEETTIKQLMSKVSAVGNGFEYVDGPITKAMRARPGELHIVVLDEVNTMRSEQTAGLHGILDAWQDGRDISTGRVLKDGTQEMIGFPKGRVYFSMTMNPSGAGYRGRKQIDDALARRCHLSQHERVDALQMQELRDIELGKKITVSQDMYLYSRRVPLSKAELMADKDYEKLHNAYIRFHNTILEKIKNKELGKGQVEGTYFGGIDMDRRMHQFLRTFHTSENGNLTSVFQKGLIYFYVQPFMKKEDRDRVLEMIAMFTKEDGKEPVTATPAPKEHVYNQPPQVKAWYIDGKGSLREAGITANKKKSAGEVEFKYIWSLMQRHNNARSNLQNPTYTKAEEELLKIFKQPGKSFYFFGYIENGHVYYLSYDGAIFRSSYSYLGGSWNPNRNRAVLMA